MASPRWIVRLTRIDGDCATIRWYGGEGRRTRTLVVHERDAFEYPSRAEAENLARRMGAAGLADSIAIVEVVDDDDRLDGQ